MRDRPDPLDPLGDAPPGHDLDVRPTRVTSARGSRGALVAGAVIAAAIAAAVGLAQLPAGPSSTPPPLAGATVRPGGASPTATPEDTLRPGIPGTTPPRLSRDDLRDRVRDGSIDEQLVFVDGVLEATPIRCQSLAQARDGCVDLRIPGIGLPVWAGSPAIPWRGDPPPSAWLVTVARARGLVYLGSLVPDANRPDSIASLTGRLLAGDLADPPGTLFEVTSWLVVHPARPCYRPPVPATPCPNPSPFLAADEPAPNGALTSGRGGTVALASPAIDVVPGAVVTRGTFLVSLPEDCDAADAADTCDPDPSWLVVARYDPGRSVRVLAP